MWLSTNQRPLVSVYAKELQLEHNFLSRESNDFGEGILQKNCPRKLVMLVAQPDKLDTK